MGRITSPVIVASALDPTEEIRFEGLIDTGAHALILPLAWRGRLGSLATLRTVKAETADQRLIQGDVVGPVSIQIEGFARIFSEAVFIDMAPSNGGYEPLVGYLVLEQSGLAVDMVGHRLVPIRHFDLK